MFRVCESYSSPLICPTDGPDYNATYPGMGKYPFSNNALESCFMDDHSILPLLFDRSFILEADVSRETYPAERIQCILSVFRY